MRLRIHTDRGNEGVNDRVYEFTSVTIKCAYMGYTNVDEGTRKAAAALQTSGSRSDLPYPKVIDHGLDWGETYVQPQIRIYISRLAV